MSAQSQGTPVDWTNGTGVLPAGGTITIPPNLYRKFLKVQNQDVGNVVIVTDAVKASDGTHCTSTLALNGAAASGTGGGSDERHLFNYVGIGAITISGTAGQKIMVLEG